MKIKNHISEWKKAVFYYLYRIYAIKQNKIVFCNYNGKGYGCNPKYIAQELIRRHPDWDYVWLVNDINTKMPKEIRLVEYNSKQSIYELATAKVWVDNQRKLWFNRKRKNQFFIATWHGAGIPMKKIGADNPNNYKNRPYKHTSKHMNKITDIMISNSEECTRIFHKAFLYKKEIINCGYPRNDILIMAKSKQIPYIQKIKNKFNIKDDEKIALYAPTYRNSRSLDKYILDYEKIIDTLSERFGGKWHFLLKLHPTMRNKKDEIKKQYYVTDASDYEDMQELLVASDILISDYSSVITEFGLMKKPIFLFATDINEYSNERDFYCDYFSLPFSVSETNEQLIEQIKSFSYLDYSDKIDKCYKKFGIYEPGNASKIVADFIEKEVISK